MAQKILLVEDEDLVAGYLKQALGRAGFEVRLEVTALDAIEAVKEEAAGLYALITDGMGRDSKPGIALCELANSLNPSLPILIISGNPPPVDHHCCGMVRYFQKPVAAMELVLEIREMRRGM